MRDIPTIVPGPQALKALTHPERLKMLGILRLEGPQTATRLAGRLRLNTGATSYHLRQLARHGFVEIDAERGNRRDKWWKARHAATVLDTPQAEGEAGHAMMQAVVSHHAAALQRAHERYPALPPDWQRAFSLNDLTIPMSPEAARDLIGEMVALLWRARENAPEPGEPLPEGWRLYTVQLDGFPHTPEDGA